MSLILLIAEILLLVFCVIYLLLTKSIVDKKTFIFSVPIFIISFLLYSLGYVHVNNEYSMLGFLESIVAAIKAFGFEIEVDIMLELSLIDPIYRAGIYLSTIISGLTLVLSILGIFKIAIINSLRVIKNIYFKKSDIVIGYDDDAIFYCKNSKAVLWIDSDEYNLSKEDKEKLYMDNIAYIYSHISSKKFNKYIKFLKGKIDVVWFKNSTGSLNNLFEILDNILIDEDRTIEFHVQTEGEHLDFINQQLTNRCINKLNVMATAFDCYELISREFAAHYNFANYLPSSFIKNGTLVDGKKISVVMLGFGKTGYSIFKSCILNNQFVKINDGKYQAYPIDFHLFDSQSTAFNKPLVNYYLHQNKYFANRDGSLPLIEATANIKTYVMDVKGEINDELLDIINSDDNHFVFYIVALQNSLDNSAIAQKLSINSHKDSSIIFYNIDHKNEILQNSSDNVIPFGYKNEILRHSIITNDELNKLATQNNEAYFKIRGNAPTKFSELNVFEKLSNIYSDINLMFKLNIMGLQLSNDSNVDGISKEEYMEIYCNDSNVKSFIYDDYNIYSTLSTRMALAYQEHLRWANFYLVNGFAPMNLNEVKFVAGKIIHKNLDLKKHACLTSFEGLDILHKYELDLFLKNGINKTINDIETYKYDLQLMDNLYDTLSLMNYKIHKK